MKRSRLFCSPNRPVPAWGNIFLGNCRALYGAGKYPFVLASHTHEYQHHAAIARNLLTQHGLPNFLGYLAEGQYYVHVWTAVFALEIAEISLWEAVPTPQRRLLLAECLDMVERNCAAGPAEPAGQTAAAGWLSTMRGRYPMAASHSGRTMG